MDPNGAYIYKAMVAGAKRDSNGFTEYSFPRSGANEPLLKIAYSVTYRTWDWFVSTGLYVDDMNAAFRSTVY